MSFTRHSSLCLVQKPLKSNKILLLLWQTFDQAHNAHPREWYSQKKINQSHPYRLNIYFCFDGSGLQEVSCSLERHVCLFVFFSWMAGHDLKELIHTLGGNRNFPRRHAIAEFRSYMRLYITRYLSHFAPVRTAQCKIRAPAPSTLSQTKSISAAIVKYVKSQ